ncbi:MAG TPA: NAD kinase [Flavobacteriales bacterium]|jgi:NAD+ kinase|nr:NAD kinase [Flavobacteriales bacterium]
MENIAIFGKELKQEHKDEIVFLFDYLNKKGIKVHTNRAYVELFQGAIDESLIYNWLDRSTPNPDFDLFISIGGDGTFLESALYVRNSNVPILGINTGRLGFLARVKSGHIKAAIDQMFLGNFELEPRTPLCLEIDGDLFGEENFGLNEVTVHKNDDASMIIINTYIDGEFLNAYWADGLIIATPTGSTAYSMSVGGPIIMPGSENLVISPVAPHNLNVRPLVIPDNVTVELSVEGRGDNFLVSLDSRIARINSSTSLRVKKAPFKIQLVKLKGNSYLKNIREKLSWGLDKRN